MRLGPAPGKKGYWGSTSAPAFVEDSSVKIVMNDEGLLASGDVQSARLLLMRGAEARDARAALLVGTTYDPALLRQIGADGPLADAAQARTWYQRAKEWGEPDAQRKLEALALSR